MEPLLIYPQLWPGMPPRSNPWRPSRHELLTHCYRILGSPRDAEDSVQETLLRAWRRLNTFEGRASFRAWLYKIATNACLDALALHPKRSLPPAAYPAADPLAPIPAPVTEPVWLEPFPDAYSGLEIPLSAADLQS
jgi:RNA polymerase sigma-70 factor, ECF subfamily